MKKYILLIVFVVCAALLPVTAWAKDVTLADLQKAFPEGAYWNHAVKSGHGYSGKNGTIHYGANCGDVENTYTYYPCTSHSAVVGVGGYDCNCFNNALQCNGFAEKLAHKVYGTICTNWANKYTNKATAISVVKPGDVIHYYGDGSSSQWGHWVFVTGVNGANITVGECNWAGRCKITWTRVVNLNSVSSLTLYSAPYRLTVPTPKPTVTFAPWEDAKYTYVRDTDAAIGQQITVSNGTCTSTGMYLYDASGKQLASASNPSYTAAKVFFKINEECHYTLAPGTTYQYKFYAVVNGTTYWSAMGSFKTTGGILITSLSLSPASLQMQPGETKTLTVTFTPSNATYKNVVWSSNNTKVATVSGGKVTAVADGTTTITVGAMDGSGKKATCAVTVKTVPTVTFAPWENANYTYMRDTDAAIGQQITVSGGTCTSTGMYLYDAAGNQLGKAANPSYTDAKVFFKINEECHYTLTPGTIYQYKFYAVVNGTTYWSAMGSFKTTGGLQITSLSLSPASLQMQPGETKTLSVTFTPSNATNKTVTWSSNNTKVATVSGGTVTAVAEGSAIITAAANDGSGKKATCTVTVKPAYWLDLNGYLDGTKQGNISGRGTVDIYVNGTLVGNDVTDYCTLWPKGTTFEIKDIKALSGYTYTGLKEGAFSGTIGDASISIRLSFSTTNGVTVMLEPNGGAVSASSVKVTFDCKYGSLPLPTRAGYGFSGWYTSPAGGVQVSSSTIVTNNSSHTLYARWVENQYTVTLNPNGGTVSPASIKVTYGGGYSGLPVPTRTGYTFEGWYTAAGGGSAVDAYTKEMSASDHTLYAHWSRDFIQGNVNGSDTADVADMACLFDYLSSGKLSGAYQNDLAYFKAVADVNEDGSVNILDYQALYEIVKK